MRIKSKLITIIASLAVATFYVSGGYGYWQKDLTIRGEITVVKPVTVLNKQLMGQPVPLDPNNLMEEAPLVRDQALGGSQADVLKTTDIPENNGIVATEDEQKNQQDGIANGEGAEVGESKQDEESAQPEQPEQEQTSDQGKSIEQTIEGQKPSMEVNKLSEDMESTQAETNEPVTDGLQGNGKDDK